MKVAFVEFIGSLAITFFGAFSRINNEDNFLAVGITYFFLIAGFTYAFRNISGSHFNPVLTISLIITNQVSITRAVSFLFYQMLGSLLGGMLIYLIHRTDKVSWYGEPYLNGDQKNIGSGLEALSIFILGYVYNILISDIKSPKEIYGVALGSVYLITIASFGLVSGGCVNLISLIGPSLFAKNFQDWPYYIFSHLVGGLLIGFVYKLFMVKNKNEDDDEDEIELSKADIDKTKVKSN